MGRVAEALAGIGGALMKAFNSYQLINMTKDLPGGPSLDPDTAKLQLLMQAASPENELKKAQTAYYLYKATGGSGRAGGDALDLSGIDFGNLSDEDVKTLSKNKRVPAAIRNKALQALIEAGQEKPIQTIAGIPLSKVTKQNVGNILNPKSAGQRLADIISEGSSANKLASSAARSVISNQLSSSPADTQTIQSAIGAGRSVLPQTSPYQAPTAIVPKIRHYDLDGNPID